MYDGVLDERLHDHARHERVEHLVVDRSTHGQTIRKAHALDVQVHVRDLELLRQRHLLPQPLVQREPEQVAQPTQGMDDRLLLAFERQHRDGIGECRLLNSIAQLNRTITNPQSAINRFIRNRQLAIMRHPRSNPLSPVGQRGGTEGCAPR